MSGQPATPANRPSRPPHRVPGRRTAAVLGLVLSVATGGWWSGRHGGAPVTAGRDAGPTTFAASVGLPDSRGEGDRASRGQPRTVPAAGGSAAGRTAPGPDPARPGRTSNPPAALPAAGTFAPTAAAVGGTPARAGRTPPASPTSTAAGAGPGQPVALTVVALTNAERAGAGCGPLRMDARLTAAATAHSVDMATRGYFSHVGPDGITPWDRARSAGYDQPSAENIAMGYPTAQAVVAGWMASAGHRANILNCASHAIGVGFDPRGDYWTQLFGYI